MGPHGILGARGKLIHAKNTEFVILVSDTLKIIQSAKERNLVLYVQG